MMSDLKMLKHVSEKRPGKIGRTGMIFNQRECPQKSSPSFEFICHGVSTVVDSGPGEIQFLETVEDRDEESPRVNHGKI